MKAKVNKILVVVNPVSGDVKKDPILERLRKLAPPKAKIQIFTTTGQNDRELLGQQMDSFLPDRLVVIGGDGTLTGANFFKLEWPSLLKVRVGFCLLTMHVPRWWT